MKFSTDELLALIRKEYKEQNVLFFEECISEWAYETAQEEFESEKELKEVIKTCVEVDKILQETLR